MEDLKKLGNIEFLNCFLTLYYQMFGLSENEFDIRIFEPTEFSKKYMANLLEVSGHWRGPQLALKKRTITETLYQVLLTEAFNRGLKSNNRSENDLGEGLIYTEDFRDWLIYMKNNPTYIREIYATNHLGGYDASYVDDEVIGFDFPVREACKILSKKGYLTYWSSANYEDSLLRIGHVVKDKSVAYILIDPQNLSNELKNRLYLNGKCDFWGIAVQHNDDGRYYGISSEITSPDMLCADLSKDLSEKALELPSLINKQDLEQGSRQL